MMKTTLLSIWLCLVLAACESAPPAFAASPPAPPAGGADTKDAPYGTPYTQVPEPKDAVLYQVNIRAFSPTGDFAGVQARLDAIRALGVNVLYLMPVYPVGMAKTVNSPYCVKDYTTVNSEFGTLADLRTLVAEAHKRNLCVLFDWVANHTSWDHAWISNKSWYKRDAAGNVISPPGTGWNDVASLNYNNPEMRKAMIEAMKYWISQVNIDGYRCDATDFVPFDFWQEALDALHAIPSRHLLLFAEGTRKDNFTVGFQLKYGMGFYENMKKIYGKKASVRSIDFLNTEEYTNAPPEDQVVRYITNHDVNQSDGPPLDVFGGKEGSLAAFVVAAYMKGVPMIYNGQEVGCPVKLSFFNHDTIIDWTLNPEMTGKYQEIIGFRNGSEALKQGDLRSFSNDDVCVFTKSFNAEEVLVIVNLRNAVVSYATPQTLVRTAWKNVFDESDLALSDRLTLQPFQYQILRKQ